MAKINPSQQEAYDLNYNDLLNLPTLGTAAAQNTGFFATAAQGALAATALQAVPASNPVWIKIATKTSADFSAAALVNTITSGYSLPIKGVVMGCYVAPTTTFSGGIISAYTVSVGVGSGASIAKYAAAQSVFTGVTLTTPQQLMGIESTGSTTAITLTATSVTGLLNAATQGSVDIYLLVSVLP